MADYQLPRGTFPSGYGDLLRSQGLGEGLSYGGDTLSAREDIPPDQIAKALALASGSGSAPISDQDVMRFLAMQQGAGAMPNFPGGGEEGPAPGTPPGSTPPATAEQSPPAESVTFGTQEGPGGKVGSVIGGILGTLAGSATGIPGIGLVTGLLGKEAGQWAGGKIGGAIGTPAPTMTDDPAVAAALASQREGERGYISPRANDPNDAPAPPGIAPTVSEAAGGTGVSGSTSGPAGEASGTGAPGAAAGDSGDAGAPGEYGRGGRVPRRTNAPGSFKGAPNFQRGGPVSDRQARMNRIRDFESKHGSVEV